MASLRGALIGAGIGSALKSAYDSAKKKSGSGSSSSSSSGSSGSSSSSSSSSSKPASSGTTGSSSGSTTTTPDWLKQAQANSQAWHSADAATRKTLEQKNQSLYSSHGYTYNPNTGKWTAPSSSSSSSSSSKPGGMVSTIGKLATGAALVGSGVANMAKQQQQTNASTDYGKTFWQAALEGGANADDLQLIADKRAAKSAADPALAQYMNDQKQQSMQAYINQMREIEGINDKYNEYYDNALQQTQDYYDKAAQQAAEQYRQLMPTVNQSYDESARQAYINARLAMRDLPEQLAAAGISGQGASESSLVQQNNAYNQAYNQNELARQQALANLENQAANAYNTTSNQGAQSVADILMQQANAQQSILAQQEQMKQNAIGNLYNYANLTGGYTGNGTLSAKELAANTAYNNRVLDMQQQNAASDAESAMRDYYLKLWEGMGNRGATAQIAAILGIPVGSVYGAGTYNANYY